MNEKRATFMSHEEKIQRYGPPHTWRFSMYPNMVSHLDIDAAWIVANQPTIALALGIDPPSEHNPRPVFGWPDGSIEFRGAGKFPSAAEARRYCEAVIQGFVAAETRAGRPAPHIVNTDAEFE